MGWFERFFGLEEATTAEEAPLALNAAVRRPLKGLQVLFPHRLNSGVLSSQALTKALRAYHPWLSHARCEIANAGPHSSAPYGLAGWDEHVIKLVGFATPLAADVTTRCVRPAHYDTDFKSRTLAHRTHVQLYYGGYCTNPLEQYVALAVVAGAIAGWHAVAVLNENALTSLPAEVLAAHDFAGDRLEMLRALPIPTLYAGFHKVQVVDAQGLWMRTQGAPLLGVQDLAFRSAGHQEGEKVFSLFSCVLHYLLHSGAVFGPGHTLQLGNELFLRARAPDSEPFLENEGDLLVLEAIPPSEINH
jgi:hypothetical protein